MAGRSPGEESRTALIEHACARNVPIEVTIPGRGYFEPLKSRFLAGRDERGDITIEAPTQNGRPVSLQAGELVDVVVVLSGQRYGFRATAGRRVLYKLGGHADVAAVVINCASKVLQLQRRRYYRVNVPPLDPLPVECVTKVAADGGETLLRFPVRAMDISAGGMLFRLAKSEAALGQAGRRLAVILSVGSLSNARLMAEVRYTRPLPHGGIAAGVQFIGWDRTLAGRKTIDAICRYVAQRQREALKKKSGLE